MAKDINFFEIDDSQTVAQNISAFVEIIMEIDEPIAKVLAESLSILSQEIAVDQAALLDALYEAAAPIEPATPSFGSGAIQ